MDYYDLGSSFIHYLKDRHADVQSSENILNHTDGAIEYVVPLQSGGDEEKLNVLGVAAKRTA